MTIAVFLALSAALAAAAAHNVEMLPGVYTSLAFDVDPKAPEGRRLKASRTFALKVTCSPLVTEKFRFLPKSGLCKDFVLRDDLVGIREFVARLQAKSPAELRGMADGNTIVYELFLGRQSLQRFEQSFSFMDKIPVHQTLAKLQVLQANGTAVNETLFEIAPGYLREENRDSIRVNTDRPELLEGVSFQVKDNMLSMVGTLTVNFETRTPVEVWLSDGKTGLESPRFRLKIDAPSAVATITFFAVYAVVLSLFFTLFFGCVLHSLEEETPATQPVHSPPVVNEEVQVLSKSITEWSPGMKHPSISEGLSNRSTRNDTLVEIDILGSHPHLERPEPELSFAAEDRNAPPAFEGINISGISNRI